MRKLLLTIAFTALLAACGANAPTGPGTATTEPQPAAPTATQPAAPTATQPAGPTAAPTAYPAPDPYPAPTEPVGPAELIEAARQRLAAQLGVDPSTLTLQGVESREWTDTSIGCPDPAATYQQVIVPGYLLRFGDGTRSYEVHTSLAATPGEPMVLCEGGRPIDLPATPSGTPADAEGQKMAELARAALAKELGIDPSTVTILSVNAVEWNDSSLGCPKPGVGYLQVITPGYLVRLEAQGRGYEYHTDSRNQVVSCLP